MAVITDPKKIAHLLGSRVERVVGDLEARLKSGKKLRIKLGVDPSKPDLHLGHVVQLRKLREFQDLGHQAVFVIGDFTAMIGDPTGKSKTRPVLTKAEATKNAKSYLAQAAKILDPKKTEMRMNSEWFGKMKFADIIGLSAHFTVARMIERDDFDKRLKEGTEVHMHELLYPMLQAYDSVALQADVEMGNLEQMFNILAGRELQKKMGLQEQCCLFVGPLLVGTDGVKKMSKSLDNYVGITESPDEMFGKVMSIPDPVLRDWFALTTDVAKDDVDAMLAGGKNPRDAKVRLAKEIIVQYHTAKAAAAAERNFIKVFQKKEIPDEVSTVSIVASGLKAGHHKLLDILALKGLFGENEPAVSKSEARRLVEQGGVKVDGVVIRDPAAQIVILDEPVMIQKGKRHFVNVIAK